MSSQYVFTMHRVSKRYPPDKVVFDDVTLAFFPGAKIGVLGLNGSGKSTLLRIMFPLLYVGAAALAATLAARWARRAGTVRAVVAGALAVALLAPYLYGSFAAAQFFNACFFGDSLVAGVSPNC